MPEANDLTVGIMALVAQQEREAISRRTREALAAELNARGMQTRRSGGWHVSSVRNLLARLEQPEG
jgi:DNA invertase Pin-like site-specific DNA recombinase